ncbi:endonuclease NucS domain-containing protein [Pseudomonas paraveronii]|uniref:endonuclease NucS domain-containing protein n=1 Tax=Pseudomonas paraveronii TaxID=3040598 RepID=UPI002AB029AA|nr:endonuclease NucS domain-containing protein [Pseudomonas sp. V3/K/3/5]
MAKSVLGLFDDERELTIYLSKNLHLIEPGMTLVATNYAVANNVSGASGSFDILALDQFKNKVIIEVKRSDQAARQALHELSKYISLFMESGKVNQNKIRCFVLSTVWHELDVPLAFFRENCPIDVKGFAILAVDGSVVVEERDLPLISSDSRLSPDLRFGFFRTETSLNKYCEDLTLALADVPSVQAALLTMKPFDSERLYMSLLCIWRIPDLAVDTVEGLISDPEFKEEYYHFGGWELETDLINWLLDRSDEAEFEFAELKRATPEKIENYKEFYEYTSLVKLGAWPKVDLINDLEEVLSCLVAKDVSSVGNRSNRHEFAIRSSKATGKSWSYACDAFKEFICHNELWVRNFTEFEKTISKDAVVSLNAWDQRHFYYSVCQAVQNPKAELSQFEVTVTEKSGEKSYLVGGWLWSGAEIYTRAKENIERDYGKVFTAIALLYSAVDQERYEYVYERHGFYAYVLAHDPAKDSSRLTVSDNAPEDSAINMGSGLSEFVKRNGVYCAEISACFATFG